MKVIVLCVLVLLAGCDPFNFGFKKNPAYVLDQAMKSLINVDQAGLVEVSGKEFLCTYVNEAGMNYLKENINFSINDVVIIPKLTESTHYTIPHYVGFWSYYHERYEVEIKSAVDSEPLMNTIIDCEYGTETEKDAKWINLKPTKYRQKDCRLMKLDPIFFEPLPLPKKCELFKLVSQPR